MVCRAFRTSRSRRNTTSSRGRLRNTATLRAIGGSLGRIPLTNYEPDFQPLSIGNQSKRIAGAFYSELPDQARMVCAMRSTALHLARRRDC